MTYPDILLLATWLPPLLLGLPLLWRPNDRLVSLAVFAAVPALLTAILAPVNSVATHSWLLLTAQVKVDVTAQAFLLFTATLWFIAGIFAHAYLQKDANRSRFFGFFLLAMAGNFGLIIADDLLSFYLWFAIMSFASYGLVVHTGDKKAHEAGQVYMILVIIGEVILFAGLVLLYKAAGGLIFGDYSRLIISELSQVALDDLATALLFIGFGIKAGVIVLHIWLPLAHPAAPIPASAVLSGAMIKAGLLGWLRFIQPLADGSSPWGDTIIILGLATAFYGAVVGVSQTNVKTVLAYSSVSQMGFIMVGVGAWLLTGDANGAALTAILIYAAHHALAKGALFLGAGFAGGGRAAVIMMLLPAFALAGLPLTSGAVAKSALKSVAGALPGAWPLDTLLALAAVGTTLLMARFLWLMWGSANQNKTMPRLMWASWLVLLVAVAAALFMLPLSAEAAVESLKADKLWPALWPILLGVLLAAAAVRIPRAFSLPLFPPGDLVVLFAGISRRLNAHLYLLQKASTQAETYILTHLTPQAASAKINLWLEYWEERLRTDWSIVGSALLLMALSILLVILIR